MKGRFRELLRANAEKRNLGRRKAARNELLWIAAITIATLVIWLIGWGQW
jgi:hypothetical protein